MMDSSSSAGFRECLRLSHVKSTREFSHLKNPDVIKTKWAAALQEEEALARNETLEYFSGVKEHQSDSSTTEKFEKLQSVTLSNLGLSDDQIPLRLASCQNIVHLDLSSNNLTSIPNVTFSLLSLKFVNFSLNRIQDIPSDIKLLTQLEKVNLSYNIISDMSPVTACANLQMLWIAGNRLSDIPTDMRYIREMTKVDFSDNEISDIGPVLGCTKLQVLRMSHNQIKRLPLQLELGELKEIDLSYNEVTDITPVVGCVKLQILKVCGNQLVGLPAGLVKLGELKELDLSCNEITDITPVIECAKLEVLQTIGNRLETLPGELVKLDELKELDLSFNTVTDLTSVVGCSKLQVLKTNCNRLEAIPEELVKLGELKELDLSSNYLTDITPVIGCTKLQILNVCDNKLEGLPAGFVELGELKVFDLSLNDVTDITPVAECARLQVLKVDNNQLVGLPAEFVKLGELNELDLSYNEITDITPVVECAKLRVLLTHSNRLKALPAGLVKLGELKDLNLSYNGLTDITPVVECAKLQVLIAFYNNLEAIPEELAKLGELKELHLGYNCLIDITPVVECVKLQILRLKGNQIMALPEELVKLGELKELDLSCNNISDITPVVHSTKLQILSASGNKIDRLPAGLVKLGELKELDLSYNKITDITPVVGCVKLQILKTSSNQLEGLPAELANFGELKEFDLSYNKITDLAYLCKCFNLTKLKCAYNTISRLPEEITQLHKLESLDISANQINQLPLHFDRCSSLTDITCIDNPLTRPPLEVCNSGPEQIFQYFKDLRATECSLRKQQVVLVGETGAGKTSLALTLKDERSYLTDSSDRTHVLQKYTWAVEDGLTLLITDFGGHQVYELAHTLFLCSEVIALVAVDLNQYKSDKYHDLIGRWVNSILLTSPKSTVMVVCTHSDFCTEEHIQTSTRNILDQIGSQQTLLAEHVTTHLYKIEMEIRSSSRGNFETHSNHLKEVHAEKKELLQCLEQNFVQPEHVFVVSSGDTMRGISELRHALITCCERKALTLPESWLLIEDRMNADDIKAKHYLPYTEFCEIVQQRLSSKGVRADQATETAEAILSYQHCCGGFLWFKGDSQLNECVFHRPEVIVDFLKSIFHHDMDTLLDHTNPVFKASFTEEDFKTEKQNFLQNGRISSALLRRLVKGFGRDEHMFRRMIFLLEKFFLCFTPSENGDGSYLFPWFLKNEEPSDLKGEKWLPPSQNEYLYEVKFVFPVQCPTGFFERAVVILHQQFAQFEESAQDVIVWKNGVYLHKDDEKALLTRKQEEGEIFVTLSVRGNKIKAVWPHFKRAYYNIVNRLKQLWPGAPCDIRYICPHCLTSNQKEPWYFTANKLLESRSKLGKYLPCKNSKDKRVSVDVVIPKGATVAQSKSPPPKRRRLDTVDRIHSEKIGATTPRRDSEELCQRGKETVSQHFLKSLMQAFTSVAKVTWSNGQTGSGFRVGSRYLLTNYHVVREDPVPNHLDPEQKKKKRKRTTKEQVMPIPL